MSWRTQNYEVLPALSVGGDQLRTSLKLVTAGWFFGAVWMVGVGGATIITCGFLAGFSDFHWGLLTSLTFIASLTQLPASRLVESTGLRKMQFIWLGAISRLMWALIGLATIALLFSPRGARGFIAWLIIAVIFASRLLEHMAVPAWMSWMADLIPSRLRGAYFARRTLYCLISQLAASVGLGILFDRIISSDQREALSNSTLFASDLPHLVWTLAVVFIVSALFGAADIFIFGRIREIVPRKPLIRLSLKEVILRPLRDRRFVCFSGSLASLNFGVGFSAPFFALLCQKYYHMSYLEMMIVLTVCGPVGSMVSSRFWGKVINSWGCKRVMRIALFGASLITWLWLMTPSDMGWLGGCWSFVSGIAWTGVGIAKVSMELGFSDREAGSSYVAANNTIVNAAGAIGGLIAGILAQSLSDFSFQLGSLVFVNYHIMLLLSGVVRFASLIWISFMPPDVAARKQSSKVIRAAAAVYHHAPMLLFAPKRMVSRGARMVVRLYGGGRNGHGANGGAGGAGVAGGGAGGEAGGAVDSSSAAKSLDGPRDRSE